MRALSVHRPRRQTAAPPPEPFDPWRPENRSAKRVISPRHNPGAVLPPCEATVYGQQTNVPALTSAGRRHAPCHHAPSPSKIADTPELVYSGGSGGGGGGGGTYTGSGGAPGGVRQAPPSPPSTPSSDPDDSTTASEPSDTLGEQHASR